MKKYIHYGNSEFIPEMVCQLSNVIRSEPDRGIWASPVDAHFGWKDWCEAEEWSCSDMSMFFKFTLSESAKILEVHEEDDIMDYIIRNDELLELTSLSSMSVKTSISDQLNLPKLYSEFDGIELFWSENWKLHRGIFNSWDCDSIVVWNPSVIVTVEED